MNIITVWSKIIKKSNRLKESINNINLKQDNLDDLIKYSREYLEETRKFKTLITDKNYSTPCKVYNAYLEANIGIVGTEFMNLKEKNMDIYNTLINSMDEVDVEELVYYNEKLIQDYTPYDIHILSGKDDEEYSGWY
ncbi:hypothetical protein [Tepidibacter aestuarii]|uniref:hypothetical protein n=1 Tax=Tepidibacter aestuarii TaxID=2925782 RepID=UPI0020BEF7E5|nr:hypothetical protein [Tepidibacter aestuarii]CAH2212602.1 conserved protein of unknown function [Tepidibacter aestuarii]